MFCNKVSRLSGFGRSILLPRVSPGDGLRGISPWKPQGTTKTAQWLYWAMTGLSDRKLTKVWAESIVRQERHLFNPHPSPLSFSSTQYLVLNNVQSDSCRTEVVGMCVASSFDFQLLGATTEALQTGKMKGKNLDALFWTLERSLTK